MRGSANYDGPARRGDDTGRREDDTVISMLREGMDSTARSLRAHVQDCEKMQKRVLVVVSLILIWIIAHSPEAAKLAASALPRLGP